VLDVCGNDEGIGESQTAAAPCWLDRDIDIAGISHRNRSQGKTNITWLILWCGQGISVCCKLAQYGNVTDDDTGNGRRMVGSDEDWTAFSIRRLRRRQDWETESRDTKETHTSWLMGMIAGIEKLNLACSCLHWPEGVEQGWKSLVVQAMEPLSACAKMEQLGAS
jgi:hypothetical protein